MTSAEIRKQFIDFFVQQHAHTFVASSPVVPHDDPTLLFTNAGMNQFKPYFLGTEKAPAKWGGRVANTQKCIRAGGKHNDLDDVGRSRRHHTFFEMLGNWSFGNYFKQGAIEMAWELLTKVWKLDPTRLHVSCYEGDEKQGGGGIPRDTEAADIWRKVANWEQYGRKSDEHIHYFGKDNFWEMGDTGPCGPCTEIYVDRTPEKNGGGEVNGSDPRVMEVWNLVFIQYNRDAAGHLTPLPSQHVDTGMGLERICQVLQGKDDNYATDLFSPLFEGISKISNLKYTGQFPPTNAADPVLEAANPQLRIDIAFRVIADHLRCLTFALTDGAVPSNEGRGYVLRRILRRAVRFGRQQLNLHDPFLHALVPIVVGTMGDMFPELTKNPQHVMDMIKEEEISFGKTLDRGIQIVLDESSESELDFAKATEQVGSQLLQINSLLGNVIGGLHRDITEGMASLQNALNGTLQNAISSTARIVSINVKQSLDSFNSTLDAQIKALVDTVRRIQLENAKSHLDELLSEMSPKSRRTVEDLVRNGPKITAETAFKLYDTFGFPVDLTRIMAEERGMGVDLEGFEKLMAEAKKLSQAAEKGAGNPVYDLPPNILDELAKLHIQLTDDSHKFLHGPVRATVRAIWNGRKLDESAEAANSRAGEAIAIILDKTNFYAEMGGQVGDSGELRTDAGTIFDVETTREVGHFVLHIGHLKAGRLKVSDAVTATVAGGRDRTEKNHTSTHLANWALRETLGDHVQQKGSLVDAEKLRFDFLHQKSMTDAEIGRVEQLVATCIEAHMPVYIQVAPQEQALKIHGLRAVFGEKYPPMVRVVSIGVPVDELLKDPANTKWRQYSIEFCGGTHLPNAENAERFVVTSEESVSKGVRRIVGLTGAAAKEAATQARVIDSLLSQAGSATDEQVAGLISALQKAIGGNNVPLLAKRRAQAAIGELQERNKKIHKQQEAGGSGAFDAETLLAGAEMVGGVALIVAVVPGASADTLRSTWDWLKRKHPQQNVAVLLASQVEEVDKEGNKLPPKVNLLAAVGDPLVGKLKAGDWVKAVAPVVGGSGGGRPQLAMAGGKDVGKMGEALEVGRVFARGKLQ